MENPSPTVQPQPAVTSTSPPLAPPPAAPEPTAEVDPATLAVEVDQGGQRVPHVPLSALREERERVSKERTQRQALEQEVVQLRQEAQANAPLMDFLRNNPVVLEAMQTGRRPQSAQPTPEDLEALEWARDYDLYDAQGQPDVARAKRMIERIDRRADRKVAPIQQNAAQQRSDLHLQQALAARDDRGRPFARPETIRTLWSSMPPELTADPRVAQTLLQTARGQDFDYLAGLPQAPANPPIHSEAPGGALPPAESISEHEQRAARDRGVSEKHWNDIVNRPGGLWAPFKD